MAKRTKPVTVADLKDQSDGPGPDPSLYCTKCGGTYSANKGDYSFYLPSNHVFKCCNKQMILVVKRISYEVVSLE